MSRRLADTDPRDERELAAKIKVLSCVLWVPGSVSSGHVAGGAVIDASPQTKGLRGGGREVRHLIVNQADASSSLVRRAKS